MKINDLVMVVRNGEFVDLVLDCDFEHVKSNYKPLLCLTYDRNAECVITGFLDGGDVIEVILGQQDIDKINTFIWQNGLYEDVKEIANQIKNNHDMMENFVDIIV